MAKKIIDGKLYDTETATLIAEHVCVTDSEVMERLYLTAKHAWFVVRDYLAYGDSQFVAITDEQAKVLVENVGDIETYGRFWPIVIA